MSNYLVPTYSICKSFSILLPNYLPRYYSNNYLGKTIFLGIANYLGITIYLIITIYLGSEPVHCTNMVADSHRLNQKPVKWTRTKHTSRMLRRKHKGCINFSRIHQSQKCFHPDYINQNNNNKNTSTTAGIIDTITAEKFQAVVQSKTEKLIHNSFF